MFRTATLIQTALAALYQGIFVLGGTQHVFSSGASSTTDGQLLPPDIIKSIQSIVDAHEVPGMSLAFVRPGVAVEFGNWGIRSEDGEAMTSDTLFTLASCSKAFTAASIGLLIEDYATGKNVTPLPDGLSRLDWDTKLQDILPGEWKLMDEPASKMAALKDILSHQTGVPRHDLSYARDDTAKDMVSRLRYLRPAFEIRERYHYNNIMFMTAQHIVTTYAGSFTDFVRDRIFLPLNMTSTTYSYSEAAESGKTTQNWGENGRLIPWWFKDAETELISGAGGIITSAQDMSHWVQMLLNSGVDPISKKRVLTPEIIEAVSLARTIMNGRGNSETSIEGYGMGWSRNSYHGHELITHNGGLPGISTLVVLSPHDGSGVVSLSNADNKHPALTEATLLLLNQIWNRQQDQTAQALFGPDTRMDGRNNGPILPHVNALQELPPHDFTGLYMNEGYGTFLLCDSKSTSAHCTGVLDDFATIDALEKPKDTELYASWPRLWTSHLRLSYAGDMRFVAQASQLFPQGFGKNTTPFEQISGTVFADFVVRDDGEVLGFGLFGFVGERTNREKKGGSIEETAEVWFDKAMWKRTQEPVVAV
ncbi:unnamed protein product [Peniophora sp. CBMAI 1063]|nr:unnamed protein product [Peniophora sp. CBMAI 1063]